jgi:hypothetical protein
MRTVGVPRACMASALVLSVLLIGCGTGSDPAAAPGETDVPATSGPSTPAPAPPSPDSGTGPAAAAGGLCALLPAEPVELALAGKVTAAEAGVSLGRPYCRLTVDDSHWMDVGVAFESQEAWLELATKVGMTVEAVTGVGTQAWRGPGTALGGPGARFTAWAGDVSATMTIYGDGPEATLYAAAAEIATVALTSTP